MRKTDYYEKLGISRLVMLLLIACLFLPVNLFAQSSITVSGTVKDSGNEPLIGATVQVKGVSTGAITNIDGKFTLTDVKPEATLMISYMGYITQEVKATASPLEIKLIEEAVSVDEVVVIGYGAMRKRDLTGAITSVGTEDIARKNPTNVFEALQGAAPGVQIVTNSGAPGSGSYVRIRGTATFGSGSEPLYVVDDMPMENINGINPSDIESMEVLKDAASAAIYGSRSANGVILITTKKGKEGKAKVDVTYNRSYNSLAYCIPLTTPDDFRYFNEQRLRITGKSKYEMIDPLKPFFNWDGNQRDLMFRTAVKNQVDASVSGASDKMNYFFSAGYYDEDGIVVNSGYQRLTTRLNAKYKVSDKFTIGNNTQFSYAKQNGISEGAVVGNIYNWLPFWNPFDATGEIMHNVGGKNSTYAQAMLEKNENKTFMGAILAYGEYQFTKQFKFRTNVSANYRMKKTYYFKPTTLLSTTAHTEGKDITELGYNWLNENYFSYENSIKDHNFSVMLGNSAQSWYWEKAQLFGQDYSTDYIWTLGNASTFKAGDNYSTHEEHSLASFFMRGTYNWKSRYLFTGNIRYDGSSRFSKDNRWGFFPSASVGWRFSDENFMQWSAPVLNDGKIRLSYGVTGNEAIGNYDSWSKYNTSGNYLGVSGMAPNLTYGMLGWEKTEQFNIGADIALLDNRLKLTVDYYDKKTTDLLYEVEVPKEAGFDKMRKNVGAMSNKGFEISLDATILKMKDWQWSANFNVSHNVSRVTTLADGIPFYTGSMSAIYVQEGARIGEFYGLRHDGIFPYDESNAYDDNWNQLTPVFNDDTFSHYTLNGQTYDGNINRKSRNGNILKGGDVNWLDNPDDEEKGIINDNDRVKLGCAQPDFFGGFNSTLTWKNLSLYVSLYYSIGGDIYNNAAYQQNSFGNDMTTPSPDAIHNMWLYPGDIAKYPIPNNDRNWNRNISSDFWIEDGSFIRLRNIKLTYNLPTELCRKIKLNGVSVSLYGNNLLTWTKYKGFDPEFGGDVLDFGIDNGRYPRKKELGFGLNVNF